MNDDSKLSDEIERVRLYAEAADHQRQTRFVWSSTRGRNGLDPRYHTLL